MCGQLDLECLRAAVAFGFAGTDVAREQLPGRLIGFLEVHGERDAVAFASIRICIRQETAREFERLLSAVEREEELPGGVQEEDGFSIDRDGAAVERIDLGGDTIESGKLLETVPL